jgi:predicted nucleotidyltransferase component of viral defense system
MIHSSKDEFLKVLERASGQTTYPLSLLEKDYYITLILSGISESSGNLIFKGGTALSKIYYSYYRLSEDIDFSMKLPEKGATRTIRRNLIKPFKEKIRSYVKHFGLDIRDVERAGHNESAQYIYYVDYESAILGRKQSIKLEIGLRFNPFLPVSKRKVNHQFLHPFTKEPLFDGGEINCFALKELVAEKMRAAATRLTIAPRDFYDLDYLIRAGFDFKDPDLWSLFKKKLIEDGRDPDLNKYRVNTGRTIKEIAGMQSRIEAELMDVLTREEKTSFNLQKSLARINKVFENAK